ncbi:MAG: hypothetical protein P0116_04030 [Candidatus Nitrosocosmicus sp.]|nr:hypothetical protein [Candidatus Nitrosocosmicus sp.]
MAARPGGVTAKTHSLALQIDDLFFTFFTICSIILSRDVSGPKFPVNPVFSNSFLSDSGITPQPTNKMS